MIDDNQGTIIGRYLYNEAEVMLEGVKSAINLEFPFIVESYHNITNEPQVQEFVLTIFDKWTKDYDDA